MGRHSRQVGHRDLANGLFSRCKRGNDGRGKGIKGWNGKEGGGGCSNIEQYKSKNDNVTKRESISTHWMAGVSNRVVNTTMNNESSNYFSSHRQSAELGHHIRGYLTIDSHNCQSQFTLISTTE